MAQQDHFFTLYATREVVWYKSQLSEARLEIPPQILPTRIWLVRVLFSDLTSKNLDHQKVNDSSFGVLRMMTLSSEKAFMLTLLTNEEQQIKSLLCRSEVPLNEVEHHCYFEQHYRRVIIVDKYIVLLSPRKIQFQTDQGVK